MRLFRWPRVITTVEEYHGQATVSIGATQLDGDVTAARRRRIVDDWCAYFRSGPSPIRNLTFVSRTSSRLFGSLADQTQLEGLSLKWGNYDDLTPLVGMRALRTLVLAGASSVRSLEPLATLPDVEALCVDGLKHVRDLSPLARMRGVVDLELGGDWMSSRRAHVDSLAFLREMTQLRRLVLHTMVVDDLDYSPLLDLTAVRRMRVMSARGMRPSKDQLVKAIGPLRH